MEIELKYNRSDFEDILLAKETSSYFKSSFTKKPFEYLLISSIISFFLITFANDSSYPIYLVISGSVVTIYLIWFLISANKVRSRRRNVKLYLDNLDNVKTKKLIIHEDFFEIQLDEERHSEKWSDIVRKEINDSFIYLVSKKETYLFPKKSISNVALVHLIKQIEKID